MNRLLALLVIVLGVVCLGAGSFFIYHGVQKNNYIVTNIKDEGVTLGLTPDQIAQGEVIHTADQLQAAAEKVKSDRKNIAPNYQAALGGKQFDPTNPKEVSYAQAMNLENYLYSGVLALGVAQVVEGVGAIMIVIAIALWAIGIVLWRLARRREYSF
jgi:hypothetical protein